MDIREILRNPDRVKAKKRTDPFKKIGSSVFINYKCNVSYSNMSLILAKNDFSECEGPS